MSATYDAAMVRLQELLDAPAAGSGPSSQVKALAEQLAATDHAQVDAVTKRVAVQPVAEDELTGQFEATVSDFEVDRQGERFDRHAFDAAVAKIRAAGRSVPVLFGHEQNSVSAVLGMIPSDGWSIDDRGLHAAGWLDVSEPLGRKMYRMLRSGALQWSIGFSVERATPKGAPGVRVLEHVGELYELSVVPVPANPRTTTTSAKALDEDPDDTPSLGDLRARIRALGLDPEADRVRHETANQMRRLMGANSTNGDATDDDAKALRAKADRLAKELTPVRIASFEC